MQYEELTSQLSTRLSSIEGSVGLYIKFLDTNQIYKTNENAQFWAASVIKIPIALTFFKKIENNNNKLSERLVIDNENYVKGSGITKLLDKGINLTYKDLVTLMLVASDNTATNQLIDFISWESVEKYMKELGLLNTTLRHKMMVTAGRGPNLTTPLEIGFLLEKMYRNELIGSSVILEIMQEQLDRTRIPFYIPNDVKISYKNGSLPEAMHEVGIIYSKNPFIFCFLSDNQKNKKVTNEVLSNCAKDCFDYSIQMEQSSQLHAR